MWKKVIGFGFLGLVVFAVGILLGHFAITKNSSPEWVVDVTQDIDESLIKEFIKEVDNKRIEDNLRELTKIPHMATSAGDKQLVKLMLDRWGDHKTGLDGAWTDTYKVFLSFPNKTKPNSAIVVSENNKILHTTQLKEKAYRKEQNDTDVVQPYAAFAPPGNPKGKLVYANQGKISDYEFLNKTINLIGTIAITRYGGAGRADKVGYNGAMFGVIGVLMSDINETYPHSWYLPPSGVERGSFKSSFGDLLTPYYPAKEHTYRRPESEIVGMAPIPTQPIGFEDAYALICKLDGTETPADWRGSFNCSYKTGPGFSSDSTFNNRYYRYVIYGNHRDSWVHGAIDPSSGTAVMLEITRILGKMVKEGKWRPRRSIIFGSWGAEEFASSVSNDTFRATGSPALQSVIFTAAKQVENPGSQTMSVYDNWMKHANRSSKLHGVIPNFSGAGSDYASFVHYLGISSMDLAFTYDRTKTKARIYPAYHTAYDTFDYASKYIDPGFTSHQAVARTAGNILLRLADSLILPFKASDYTESLEKYFSTALEVFGNKLVANGITLDSIKEAVEQFKTASSKLEQEIQNVEKNIEKITPLKIRMINDQLMLLERAFLDPVAFPDKTYYRHVIWAPKTSSVSTFPGLADAFAKADRSNLKSDWEQVKKHITIVTQAIEQAASILEAVI
uniref:Aminopeptidase NAALADL1 n=1 Tax=Erpetoichthys calabaricus TaxID=27687 RepID=A0A8C4X2G3_ERPCA